MGRDNLNWLFGGLWDNMWIYIMGQYMWIYIYIYSGTNTQIDILTRSPMVIIVSDQ